MDAMQTEMREGKDAQDEEEEEDDPWMDGKKQ